jgi:hypothetical protein
VHEQKEGSLVTQQYFYVCLLFFSPLLIAKSFITPFNYTLSGYIKGEVYGDSRQTFDLESTDLPFFPTPHVLDPTGQDINARGQTQIDAFETRVRATLDGPIYHDVKIEGVLETDFEIFFPHIVNLFHMRHAYGKIIWPYASLLFGQTWHPLVLIDGNTVDYNGSTPFDYYARSPQLTFTYNVHQVMDIIASTSMEVDYTSDGPQGPSSQYMRWATVPNFHLQLRWLIKEHTLGVAADYKRIAPRIVSNTGFRVHERLSSGTGLLYCTLKWPAIEWYIKATIGQNTSAYNGMGGYAVEHNSIDPVTGQQSYANLLNGSLWVDVSITQHEGITPGLFVGISKNFGANKKINPNVIVNNVIVQQNVYGFATNVSTAFRVSPRLLGKVGSIVFAGEVEYTRAYFGTVTQSGKVVNTTPSDVIRPTFAAYYYF